MIALRRVFLFAAALAVTGLARANEPSVTAWALALRTNDAVHATFTEARHLPIRREPLLLTGELRFQADLGLSLHYLTPEERTVIVDARGVALRDARGRTKRAPARSEAAASAQVLLTMLRFDFDQLDDDFTITGTAPDTEGAWTLNFVPRPAAARRGLRPVLVQGHAQAITQLTLAAGEPDEIDIAIDPAERVPSFDAAALSSFFR